MKYISPQNRSAFNENVWNLVRKIPPGKVATYGQIAALVPLPSGMTADDYRPWGARWVGSAMAACPEDVPWQRVINSQGKISLGGEGGHLTQRDLLEDEGVEFDQLERVDLKRFGWEGPTDSDRN
jgi:methylated-DNA-protein-cysteine methyltransferase-like protein